MYIKIDMKKQKLIDEAVLTMAEVPSTTKVKGWSFKFDGNYYLVVSYWMQTKGDCIAVFPANKKGKRSTQKWVAAVDCCKDPVKGIVALADLLIKEEEEETSQKQQ
jgi:hypothetical protein